MNTMIDQYFMLDQIEIFDLFSKLSLIQTKQIQEKEYSFHFIKIKKTFINELNKYIEDETIIFKNKFNSLKLYVRELSNTEYSTNYNIILEKYKKYKYQFLMLIEKLTSLLTYIR